MDDLIVLLKVLDLLHDLFENFGAVLWRIAVFYKADLDLQLQLIADVLIVQPANEDLVSIISLTFCARALHLSLMTAPSTSLSVPYSKSYWSLGALFCMLGCIYSGIKKSMTAHKYFAYSSLLCMGMSIYSGHKLVSPKKKKITKSNNSENS